MGIASIEMFPESSNGVVIGRIVFVAFLIVVQNHVLVFGHYISCRVGLDSLPNARIGSFKQLYHIGRNFIVCLGNLKRFGYCQWS